MLKARLWLAIPLLLGLMGVLTLLPTSVALADENVYEETSCGDESVTDYTTEVNLPVATYDVYIKLGLPGQTGLVELYDQKDTCHIIGKTTASGDSWVRLGTFTTKDAESLNVLQLSSTVLKEIPDANRPSLLFLDSTNPACQPKRNCELIYKDHAAYIRTVSLTSSTSSLNIATIKDPSTEKIVNVKYYADSQLMYTLPTLEEFDLRYSSYYKQKLTRVVEFASGQAIILEDATPLNFNDGIPNMLLRFSATHAGVIIPLAWSVAFLLIFGIMYIILHILRAREYYNYAHGFIHDPTGWHLKLQNLAYSPWYRRTSITGLVLTTSLIIVIATNSFALQIYTVNGVSMQQTLQDGDKLLVNKLPVTFSKQYSPKRGEILIVHPNFGSSIASEETETGTLVKRVLGLPGDRVVINNGIITIFNSEKPEGFNVDAGSDWEKTTTLDESQDQIDIQLAEDEIFICGDNRPESIDSRYNGAISLKQIIGVVIK